MSDAAARWLDAILNAFITGGGVWYTAYQAGAHGVTAWLPTAIAAAGSLRASIRPSPRGPIETLNVNPPNDPVITKEQKNEP